MTFSRFPSLQNTRMFQRQTQCRCLKFPIPKYAFWLTWWLPWSHWIHYWSRLWHIQWWGRELPLRNCSVKLVFDIFKCWTFLLTFVLSLRFNTPILVLVEGCCWPTWNATVWIFKWSKYDIFKLDFIPHPAEFPYIVYYTINTTQTDPFAFFTAVKSCSLSKFDPKTTRYSAAHTLDIYSEVASICRPPLQLAPNDQANVKKTPTTAYIISVYKVFEGDDGERFERNWLYWTGKIFFMKRLKVNSQQNVARFPGARCIYRYLPKSAGLRRITLNKCMIFLHSMHFQCSDNPTSNLYSFQQLQITVIKCICWYVNAQTYWWIWMQRPI